MMIYGLPERLRILREKNGLSQHEVAKRLKVSPSAISGYESGERTPSLQKILSLSYLYNCSTDYLLGKNQNDNPHIFIDVTELSNAQRRVIGDFVDVMKNSK